MKIAASIVSAFVAGSITANAFVAPHKAQSVAFAKATAVSQQAASSALKSMSDELDLPCEDDCALESYPNLPESVHPGVNTGQAMLDLLQHAKDNGEFELEMLAASRTVDARDYGPWSIRLSRFHSISSN